MNTKERITELEGCVKELKLDIDYLIDEKIDLEYELRDLRVDIEDLKNIVRDRVSKCEMRTFEEGSGEETPTPCTVYGVSVHQKAYMGYTSTRCHSLRLTQSGG